TLAVGESHSRLTLLDIAKKTEAIQVQMPPDKVVKGRANSVFGVASGDNGKILATATFDGIVRLWSRETGKLVREMKGHTDILKAVAISDDGKLVASCGCDKTVRVWDLTTGNLKQM